MNANRFDMPAQMRAFLTTAIRNRTIDAADVWELACNHSTNWAAIRDEVMQAAFNSRHANPAAHAELCTLNDECHRILDMGLTPLYDLNF